MRWADSMGMMTWTNCIGSERNRSIGGQHPPRTSPIDSRLFDSVNFPSRESKPRSISRVFSFRNSINQRVLKNKNAWSGEGERKLGERVVNCRDFVFYFLTATSFHVSLFFFTVRIILRFFFLFFLKTLEIFIYVDSVFIFIFLPII